MRQWGNLLSGLWIRIDLVRIRIRIRIQHLILLRIRIPMRIWIQFQIQGFDDQQLKKMCSWKFLYIFLSKMQFTYPRASLKDAQTTGEAFYPQKRTSDTSKHENSLLFSIFVGHFCPPGSGSRSSDSNQCGSMRIRIHNPVNCKSFFVALLF